MLRVMGATRRTGGSGSLEKHRVRSSSTKPAPKIYSFRYWRLFPIIICSAVVQPSVATNMSGTPDRFGTYPVVGETEYRRYKRESRYIALRDGVNLAVDVYRPMDRDGVETEPLPVIFYYARYWRAKVLSEGLISTNLGILPADENTAPLVARDSSGRLLFWDTGRESIPEFLRRGYIFVRAEGRGTGASEGFRLADYTKQEAKDGADIIDWIADQPWSNGKVGMIGGSYPGIMQLKVAAEKPEALKAIFPAAPAFDHYRLRTAGTGALHKGVIGYIASQAKKDGLEEAEALASQMVPVDDDQGRKMLSCILQKRAARTPPAAVSRTFEVAAPQFAETVRRLGDTWGLTLRESLSRILDTSTFLDAMRGAPDLQAMALDEFSVYRDAPQFNDVNTLRRSSTHLSLDGINRARIPIYIWTGWYDMDTVGSLMLFRNLDIPKKITVGPWSHGPNEDNGKADSPLDAVEAEARELLTAEALRWFDYWLKNIDNGIMHEPAVHYGFQVRPTRIEWRTSDEWPLTSNRGRVFYLTPKKSGSIASIQDGSLDINKPNKVSTASLIVDYRSTMGTQTRYHDSFSGVSHMAYPDLEEHARTALTFTTAPLGRDLLIAGHPVVSVMARSTAADGDLFFYLEDVSPDGATYVSEAVIRASHRIQATPPYDKAGLPYSDSRASVVENTAPFNEGFVELQADFQPSGYLFKAGHRIRLVVTGADADNYITPPILPSPTVAIQLGGNAASSLTLPVAAQ